MYVQPSLTFRYLMFCPHSVLVFYGFQNKQQIFPYTDINDWFLYTRWSVFTTRYELGLKKDYASYLKGLNHFMINLYSSVLTFTSVLTYFQMLCITPRSQPTINLEFWRLWHLPYICEVSGSNIGLDN
jgi:hypothetical protein